MKDFFAIAILNLLQKALNKDKNYGYQCQSAIEIGKNSIKEKQTLKDKLSRKTTKIKNLKAEIIRYREKLDTDILIELDNA